jgi:YidC/Oxa1 family membrane protein insertase
VIDTVLDAFEAALTFLHDIFVPVFADHSWGWAIIALTLVVRIALLPLAIKQTRSMRAMQALQPQIKELQKKYKVDRELMRKDPEQYKAKKAKLNEEMMALYQREGANPAASCLPLLAQAPIFLALFYTLRRSDDLIGAPFYFFTRYVPDEGLAGIVSAASWPGWLLIVLMSGTMFVSQKQMMARTAATQGADSNPMAQQQKILLYVMPVFLAVISFQFPLGILLYWVTTNFWQVAQQWIILREVQHEVEEGTLADKPGGGAAARWMRSRRNRSEAVEDDGPSTPRRISPGASSGKKPVPPPAATDRPADEGRDGSPEGVA